jgi:hypothetical protein
VKCEHAELQESARIGDADQFIAKHGDDADKDDAGYVRGTKRKKEGVKGEGVFGTLATEARGPNRPVNNTPFAMEKRQLALLTDIWAHSYANRHRISKSQAYDELMRDEPLFRDGWRAGLVPTE